MLTESGHVQFMTYDNEHRNLDKNSQVHSRKNNVRIDPRIIVACAVPETQLSNCVARFIFGAAVATLVAALLNQLFHDWSLLFGIFAGLACARESDGKNLLQLGAEISGHIRPNKRLVRNLGIREQVRADAVAPGDFIHSKEDYRVALEEYRARREEARKEHEIAEKERRLQCELRGDEWHRYHPRNFYFLEAKPKRKYHTVLFISRQGDGRLVFTTTNGETRPYAPHEPFERRRPRVNTHKEDVKHAAACLSDLLYLVEGRPRSEEDIIAALSGDHDSARVRRAIRAALSMGLLRRLGNPKRFLCEVAYLIYPSTRFQPFHLRKIALTERGVSWVQLDRNPEGAHVNESKKHSQNINFFGNVSFTESSVSGDVNKTTYINNHYTEISEVLAQAVSLVRRNQEQLQRFTEYSRELLAAADVLQAAIAQGEVQTPRARQALNVMVRAGEGLFLGVAGNTLYDQLKQVAQALAG